jgi:hypothetical protein
LLALVLVASCAPSAETPARRAEPVRLATAGEPIATAALARFSKRRAMRHVRRLARDIGVRVRANTGEYRASRYIRRRFRSHGYNVKIQKFSVDSDTSRNVIARSPDIVDHPFVIGAHMDTVSGSPGANDNASGVAVMLEIARLVSSTAKARFIKFIAFGAEEYGQDGRHHVGSQVNVNRLSNREVRRTPGMISVDMIADGTPLIVGTSGIGPEIVARTLYRKIRRAGISVTYRTTCDCSDNGPFERAGIPAAFMWSGDEPDYHSPSDRVRNLEPDHLRRTGRAVRVFVKSLSRALLRRFREH